MKRLMLTAAMLMSGMTLQAQLPYNRPMTNPYYRPPVNPILNTLGGNRAGGIGGGIGYYSQTRPQIDAFRQLGQLQQGQLLQGQQLAGLQAPGSPLGMPPSQGITGHSVAFFNYSHYYTFPSPRYPGSTGAGASPLGGTTPVTSPLQDPNFGRAPQGPGIGIVVGTPGRDDR